MDHPERVEVRIRKIFGPEGETAVAHTVYCPLKHESKLLVDCETCERCRELSPEQSFVVCELPPGTDKSSAMERIARRFVERLTDSVTIGEVMTREVLCVRADFCLESVRALLLDRGISGVPVVDEAGFPVGIISKTDFLREGPHQEEPVLERRFGFHLESPGATARELMTPLAFTLEEARPLSDAIKLMVTERIHRVPVVDQEGRVAGMLSTMDLLRWLDA